MSSEERFLRDYLKNQLLPKLTIPKGVKVEIGLDMDNKGKCPPPYIHLETNGHEGFIRGNTCMILLENEPEHMHICQFTSQELSCAIQESINFIARPRIVSSRVH